MTDLLGSGLKQRFLVDLTPLSERLLSKITTTIYNTPPTASTAALLVESGLPRSPMDGRGLCYMICIAWSVMPGRVHAGESDIFCGHCFATWSNYMFATALGIISAAAIVLLIQNRRWRNIVIAARQRQATTAHAARLALAGELTASIAHQLSQPLAAILSNVEAAELLIQKQPPGLGEISQILADVRRDDVRAAKIVRNLRSFLRKRELQLEDVDVNAIVSTVLQLVQHEATRQHIVVRTLFDLSLPRVRADPAHLQQVLLNLILNAIEAMTPIRTNTRLLELRTAMFDAKSVLVAVADTGSGLAEEQLPTLFNSFVTTKPEGMGLGLSIARAIVQAHRGEIWAEAAASGGAVFKFTLPIKLQ